MRIIKIVNTSWPLMFIYFFGMNIPVIMHLIPPPPTLSMVLTLQTTTSVTSAMSLFWSGLKLAQPLHSTVVKFGLFVIIAWW